MITADLHWYYFINWKQNKQKLEMAALQAKSSIEELISDQRFHATKS